jgi:hypothetical protein
MRKVEGSWRVHIMKEHLQIGSKGTGARFLGSDFGVLLLIQ